MGKVIAVIIAIVGVVIIGLSVFAAKKVQDLPELNQDYFDTQVSDFLKSNSSGELIKNGHTIKYEIKRLQPVLYNNSLSLRTHIVGTAANGEIKIEADLSIQGTPELRGKSFFFKQLEGKKAEFHHFDAKIVKEDIPLKDRVKGIFQKDTKKIEESGSLSDRVFSKVEKPGFVQKLENDVKNAVEETVKNILEDEQLMQDLFAEAVRIAFTKLPIYTLGDNMAEEAVAMALVSVTIENSIMVIKVSFWQLGARVIMLILLGIVLIGFSYLMVTTGFASWFLMFMP